MANDTNPMEAGADRMRQAGEAMTASGQKMAESSSAIGVKMIEQAEANTQQAFAAMRAAAQAQDIAQVMRIQSEYLRDHCNRSVAQAREMGELIMQFGREAVQPLQPKGGDRS